MSNNDGCATAAKRRPLRDKRVLVTRAEHQAAAFQQLLEAQGALVAAIALIEIVPPPSWQPLDDALAQLEEYRYLILTSVNAVQSVYQRLQHLGGWQRAYPNLRWVCVGPKTAQALHALGRNPDLQPAEYRAEGVVELLIAANVSGTRILYPRAELARDVIPSQLRAAGAEVVAPIAYRTLPCAEGGRQIRELLRRRQLDIVTFGSSSSVENFVSALGDEARALTQGVILASIGPLTTASAQRHGLTIAVEAPEFTLEGLITALVDHYNRAGTPDK